MTFVKIVVAAIVIICVLFFFLGLKSQKGSPIGLENGRLAECPSSPNCVCSEEGGQPERFVQPVTGTLEQAKAAVTSLGGVITSDSDEYVSATFMSSVFKFVDDVEFRPGADGQLHIRSASRVGYSDRGVNQKRVAAIKSHINDNR